VVRIASGGPPTDGCQLRPGARAESRSLRQLRPDCKRSRRDSAGLW